MVEGRQSMPQRPSRHSTGACNSANHVGGTSPLVDDTGLEPQRTIRVVRMRSASPISAPSVPLQGGSLQVRNHSLKSTHTPAGFGGSGRSSSVSFRPGLGQETQLAVKPPSGCAFLQSAPVRVVRTISPEGVRYRSLSPRDSHRCIALTGGASPPIGGLLVFTSPTSATSPSRISPNRRAQSPTSQVLHLERRSEENPSKTLQASLAAPSDQSIAGTGLSVATSVGSSVSVANTNSARARLAARHEASDIPVLPGDRLSRQRRQSNSHNSTSNLSSKAIRLSSQPASTSSSTMAPSNPASSPKLGSALRKNLQAPQHTPSHYVDPLLARTPLAGPKGKQLGVSVLANRLRSVGTSWEPPFDVSSSTSSDWRNDLRPLAGTQGRGPWMVAGSLSSSTPLVPTSPTITGNAVASSSSGSACTLLPSSNGLHADSASNGSVAVLTSPMSEAQPHLQARQRATWPARLSEDPLLQLDHSMASSSTSPAPFPSELCRLPIEVADLAYRRPRMHSASETSLSDNSINLPIAEVYSPPRSARAIMAKPLAVSAGSGSYPPVRQTVRDVQACSPESEEQETETRPPSSDRGCNSPSGECTPPFSARTRPLDGQGMIVFSAAPNRPGSRVSEATNDDVEREVVLDPVSDRHLARSSSETYLWEPLESETTLRRWWRWGG